jgi:hypothetical protein
MIREFVSRLALGTSFETRPSGPLLRMRFHFRSRTYLTLRSERSERLEGPVERFTSSQDEVGALITSGTSS